MQEQLIQLRDCAGVVKLERRARRIKNLLERLAAEGVSLAGLDLRQCRLGYARLAGADLNGANLDGADLRGAVLLGADLRGADLRHTRLSHTLFAGAKLAGCRVNWHYPTLIGALLDHLVPKALRTYEQDLLCNRLRDDRPIAEALSLAPAAVREWAEDLLAPYAGSHPHMAPPGALQRYFELAGQRWPGGSRMIKSAVQSS